MSIQIDSGVQITGGITVTDRALEAIVLTMTNSPYVVAYRWDPITGFGAKYADPTVLPPDNSYSVKFSKFGGAVAVGHTTTPFISAYQWNWVTGFGSKYSNPSTLLPMGSTVNSVDFSPSNQAILLGVGGGGTNAYAWSDSTGFGTKYSAPSSDAATSVESRFNPAGTAVVTAGGNGSAVTYAWAWSDATGFGANYANPVNRPISDAGTAVAWSAAGDAVAFGLVSSYFRAWTWTDAGGFGTQYTGTIGTNSPKSLAFSPTGGAMIAAANVETGVGVAAWTWNSSSASGIGTRYANPSTPPLSVSAVAFSKSGNVVACASSVTGYIYVYPWSDTTGFGAKYADPTVLPPAATNNVAFYPG